LNVKQDIICIKRYSGVIAENVITGIRAGFG
jgi:hypothetical protein